jgi:hypothetical protein
VICPDCLTLREQRTIRSEQVRVLRRSSAGYRYREEVVEWLKTIQHFR